jgi:HSP20 family protein
MTIVKWNPMRDLMNINREFDGLFGDVLGMSRRGGELENWQWAPRINVEENDDGYEVTAELPGMTKDDIDIDLKGELLTIRGEKKIAEEKKEKNYHVCERVYGKFARTIRLPEHIDRGKIDAEYKDGVLKLNIPKIEEVKPKEIKVKVK